MSQQSISNGEKGLAVRNAINANFTELYGSLQLPIKITGMNANFIQAISANTMLQAININPKTGGPITLRIGLTANGEEILSDTVITTPVQVQGPGYNSGAVNLYFTFTSGSGTLNVRIDMIKNFN